MIDLYRRLGASGPRDRDAIERALNDPRAAPEVRRIAAFVIGDPDRRAVHDAAWATVSVVARLRTLMMIELTPMWTEAGVSDFAHAATDPRRTRECMPVKATPPAR
jgi:hypothetical protein